MLPFAPTPMTSSTGNPYASARRKLRFAYFLVALMRLAWEGSVPSVMLTVMPGFKSATVAFRPFTFQGLGSVNRLGRDWPFTQGADQRKKRSKSSFSPDSRLWKRLRMTQERGREDGLPPAEPGSPLYELQADRLCRQLQLVLRPWDYIQ